MYTCHFSLFVCLFGNENGKIINVYDFNSSSIAKVCDMFGSCFGNWWDWYYRESSEWGLLGNPFGLEPTRGKACCGNTCTNRAACMTFLSIHELFYGLITNRTFVLNPPKRVWLRLLSFAKGKRKKTKKRGSDSCLPHHSGLLFRVSRQPSFKRSHSGGPARRREPEAAAL